MSNASKQLKLVSTAARLASLFEIMSRLSSAALVLLIIKSLINIKRELHI